MLLLEYKKKCDKCGEIKNQNEFWFREDSKNGYRNDCIK